MPRTRKTTEERLKQIADQEARLKERKLKQLAKQRKERLAADKDARKARAAALFSLGGAIIHACRNDQTLIMTIRKALETVPLRDIDVQGLTLEAPWILPDKHRPAEIPPENA